MRETRANKTHATPFLAAFGLGATLVLTATQATPLSAAEPPAPLPEGAISAPATIFPESPLLSPETRAHLKAARNPQPDPEASGRTCPSMAGADIKDIPAIRRCEAEAFYESRTYKRLMTLFPVSISSQTIGTVPVEIYTPPASSGEADPKRVLINVHGGAFIGGARTLSRIESAPIAYLGRIRVVSVDYRMGPDYAFPAASEDVATVYRHLLKDYKPENIGIYGCSAGGLLTAQSIAWFLKEKLPLPGAIGILCEGGVYWTEGDSSRFVYDTSAHTKDTNPYFNGVSADNSLAFPARSREILRQFPPTLLVSGTRDFALSSTVYTHSRLVAEGVDARLHVWEGLPHAFHMDPDLPESQEVFSVIIKFFNEHLGRP